MPMMPSRMRSGGRPDDVARHGGGRGVAALALLISMLPGCAAEQAILAAEGRRKLIGLAASDIRLCAGVPNRVARLSCGDYWTYERSPPASGGLSINFPVVGGGLNLNGAGDCRATFEFVRGRVTRIGYSGANDLGPARNAACAPVVQDCLAMLDDAEIAPAPPPASAEGCTDMDPLPNAPPLPGPIQ